MVGKKLFEKLRTKRLGLLTAFFAILLSCVIAVATTLGGGISANAMTTSNAKANAIFLMSGESSSTTTSSATSVTFNGTSLTNLYTQILPSTGYNKTYEGLQQYVQAQASGGVKASTIKANNSSKDVIVAIGGLYFTVAYVSETKTGDVIATLWLTDSSQMGTHRYSQFSANGWYNDYWITNMKKQSNLYGSSYIRSVVLNNGTTYTKAASSPANADSSVSWEVGIQTTANPLARFTMENNNVASGTSKMTTSLTKFIEKPQNVAWQEDENWYVTGDKNFTLGSEAYGTPKGTQNWWVGGSGTSVNPTEQYRNMKDAYDSTKPQYNAWAGDYVWLPSLSETGYGSGDAPSNSIWGTTLSQRQNADGSTDSLTASSSLGLKNEAGTAYTSTVYNRTWLRSGRAGNAHSAYGLSPSGGHSDSWVSGWLSVRPALHLNLKSAALSAADAGTASVSVPTFDGGTTAKTVEYNGAAQTFGVSGWNPDFMTVTVESGLTFNETTKQLSATNVKLTSGSVAAYTATFKLKKTTNKWSDGTAGTTSKTLKITINQKPLSVLWDKTTFTYTGAGQAPKPTIYDASGTAIEAANITLQYKSGTGAYGSAVASTATATTVNAGSYTVKAILASSLSNYKISKAEQTYTIDKKNIAVTGGIADVSVAYGDTVTTSTINTASAVLDGVITADKANVKLAYTGISALADKNVGTKFVDMTGLSITGTAAGNYNLTTTKWPIAVKITPRKVTVTGITADGKTYDGTSVATLKYTGAVINNIVSGESLEIEAEGVFVNATAGTGKTVNIKNITLKDKDTFKASNYEVVSTVSVGGTAYPLQTTATANIAKKQISVAITAETGVIYGAVPSVNYTVTQDGTATGENVLVTLTYKNGADSTTVLKTAGTYAITATVSSAFSANYEIKASGVTGNTVTIAKAPLNIVVADKEMEYGGAVPSLAFTAEGFKYGDTQATVLAGWAAKTAYTSANGVGDFVIRLYDNATTPVEVTNAYSGLQNYTLTVTNGQLTVNGKKIVVTITNTSGITYGDTFNYSALAFTVPAGALEAGDTESILGITLSVDGVANGARPAAGTYTIKGTASGTKYAVEFVEGELTVSPKSITLSVADKTLEYGAAPSTLTNGFATVAAGTFVGSETVDVLGVPQYFVAYAQYGAAGEYTGAITVTGFVTSSSDSTPYINPNYNVTVNAGKLTVTPKEVEVSIASSFSSVYGDVEKNVTYTVNGLARASDDLGIVLSRGQTGTVIGGSAAVTGNAAGEYPVILDASGMNDNYKIVKLNTTTVSIDSSNKASNDARTVSGVKYTIEKAKLTVTPINATISTGEALPENSATQGFGDATNLGVTVTGLKNSDTIAAVLGGKLAFTFTKDGVAYTPSSAAGAYDINLIVSTLDNYDVVTPVAKGVLTVNGAAVVLTINLTGANGATSAYGEPVLTGTQLAALSGALSVSGVSSLADLGTITLSIEPKTAGGTVKDAGEYVINADWSNKIYNVTVKTGTYVITPREITVAAKNQTLVYGSAVSTLTNDIEIAATSANQLVTGDTLASLGTPVYSVGYTQYGAVGNGYKISVSGLTANSNYAVKYTEGTLTVTPKAITDITVNNQSSVYGDDFKAVTYTSADLVNGDSLGLVLKKSDTLKSGTVAANAKNAGEYAIEADGLTAVSGVYELGNYTLAVSVLNTALTNAKYTVDKAVLTVTARSGSITVGSALPSTFATEGFGVIADGFKNSDSATILNNLLVYAATGYTTSSAAGTEIAITVAFTSGSDLANYSVTFKDGSLYVVNAAAIVVTLKDITASGVYGDSGVAISKSGINGDKSAYIDNISDAAITAADISLKIMQNGVEVSDAKNAGKYVITAELTGDKAGLYTVVFRDGSYTINPRNITVNVKNQEITYGDNPANIYSSLDNYSSLSDQDKLAALNGVIELATGSTLPTGDTLVMLGEPKFSVGYAQYGAVGNSYVIKLSGLENPNYNITFADGTLNVKQKNVSITINNASSVYGDAISDVEYNVTGLVANDKLGLVLEKTAILADNSTATNALAAGVYKIAQSTSSALNANYNVENLTVAINGATYTIEKAELVVTPKDGTINVGGTFDTVNGFGVTVSGWKNGDTDALLSGMISYATNYNGGAAGTYEITVTVSGTLDNYNINSSSNVKGSLYVGAAIIVVTINVPSTVYGDAVLTDSILNGSIASYVTLSDSSVTAASLGLTLAIGKPDGYSDIKNVGKYPVTCTSTNNSYTIKVTEAYYEITPRAITVKANDVNSFTYGDDPDKVTYGYTDVDNKLVIGDSLGTAVYSVGYMRYGKVGTYGIKLSGLANPNYDITFVDGTLTVKPKAITVTIDSHTVKYGDKFEALTSNINTFAVGGENLEQFLELSLTLNAGDNINKLGVATYAITGKWKEDTDGNPLNGNYTVTLNTNATYKVEKAKLTVTANNGTVVYGDELPANGYGYTAVGFAYGEDETVFTSGTLSYTYNYNRYDPIGGGSYTITPSGYGATQGNYDITYVDGVLTVAQREVTLTIKSDGTKEYDGTVIALAGDYYTVTSGSLARTTDDLQVKLIVENNAADAGYYAVKPDGAGYNNANYKVTFVNGSYTVTPKLVTVEWLGKDGTANETVSGASNFVWEYNGTAQGPAVKLYGSDNNQLSLTVTVNGKQTNAGSNYTAFVQLPDTDNYAFANGTSATKNFEISTAKITVGWKKTSLDGSEVGASDEIVYEYRADTTQSPVPVFKLLSDSSIVTGINFSVSGATAVGNHTATVTIYSQNYEITGSATRAFTIKSKDNVTFTWYFNGIAISETEVTGHTVQKYEYNGNVQAPNAVMNGNPNIYYVITNADGSSCGNAAINAGSYKITAYSADPGYGVPEELSYVLFDITKIEVQLHWSSERSFEYNGAHQAPEAWYEDKLHNNEKVYLVVTYTDGRGAAQTETKLVHANYKATAANPSNANYVFADSVINYVEYAITAKNIKVEWDTASGDWTAVNGSFETLYDGTEQTRGYKASMFKSDADPSDLALEYVITKDGTRVNAIRDVGNYTVSVKLKNYTTNYKVTDGSYSLRIKPVPLAITIKANDVAYKAEKADYTVNIVGSFVSGESLASLGLGPDSDGNYFWITTSYTASANPGTTWTVGLTNNTNDLQRYNDALANYDVTFASDTFSVATVNGTVSVQGWKSDVNYFIYDGKEHTPEAYYFSQATGKWTALDVVVTDGPAKEPGIYHVKVAKPLATANDGITLVDENGNPTDEFTFEIKKIVIVIEITDYTATYGEVTKSNLESKYTQLTYNYVAYTEYGKKCLPLPEDVENLAINVRVNVTDSDFDGGDFLNSRVTGYTVTGSWNNTDILLNSRYEVKFEGQHGNGQSGVFYVNKAEISVPSRGQELFDEELPRETTGVVISLSNKDSDGKYTKIMYEGWGDAPVTLLYEDRIYDLTDQDDLDDMEKVANYSKSAPPKILAAGRWGIRYRIEVPNHEPLEGVWRVLVYRNDEAIIVLFQNSFEVSYGDGIPSDLLDKLFGVNEKGEEYFTLDPAGAVTDKNEFKNMLDGVTVLGVNSRTRVGEYNIYFELKPGSGSAFAEYGIMYRGHGSTDATNEGRYVINPRKLTVDWGLDTDTFVYDGENHAPVPTISGWANGKTLVLSGASNGQNYFYNDNGMRVTVTVRTSGSNGGGDFTSIGDHQMTISLDNINYEIAEPSVPISIKGDTTDDPLNPDKLGSIPQWIWYVAIAAGVLLLLIIIILAVKLKKRKPAGGYDDEDGFSDPYIE